MLASLLVLGLILLLGSGVHIVWAFWEVYGNNSWHDKSILLKVGAWYVAAVIGSACGACLVTTWTKKQIYVRHFIKPMYKIKVFECHPECEKSSECSELSAVFQHWWKQKWSSNSHFP